MRLSVTQLFQKVSASVNQEASAPAVTSDEWSLWLEYLNRAIQEWSEVNDWEVLRKVFYPGVTGVSTATVSLPLDFKKLAAPVRLHLSGDIHPTVGEEFPDILWEEEGLYTSTAKYVKIFGGISDGQSLIFHPGTLASGASLEVQYFSMPTSLASPANIPIVPDSQFLVDRTIAYILESRSDARFQQVESKAQQRLLLMIENVNAAKWNSYDNSNPVGIGINKKLNFRLGRD